MDVSDSVLTASGAQGYSLAESPRPSGSKPSGLTLVLPALKNGKPVKSGKKSKQRYGSQPASAAPDEEKRLARPMKLKPLKEVLTKLITQIKKKDDYAFFLTPVDTSQVPGYLDVIKRPMDFGTMTMKVQKGKYRSLEEFTSDLRLVTTNAKTFNPPGTIYYTEADRIEAWGLEHIAKAAPTVIQYETDWNIDVEKEDDGQTVNIEDDDDMRLLTPMDIDDSGTGGRSPSVLSQVQPGITRRAARSMTVTAIKKSANPTRVSESVDAEGRLPGSKDGLGAFPPGSDWANTMLALKLKGKRYRTKKERLRVEKEGPPTLPDGSLDYTEMEDPFSILSFFVPDPLSRPLVTPLYPPFSVAPDTQQLLGPPSSQTPRPSSTFPTSINLPLNHSLNNLPSPSVETQNTTTKRRHWVITRTVTRSKVKEKEDDSEPVDTSAWQVPREVHAADFGSFAPLAAAIEEEMRRRGLVGREGEEEDVFLRTLREGMSCESAIRDKDQFSSTAALNPNMKIDEYWSSGRAMLAEDYIRDLVYGGVDGLAYVRSLAEFVAPQKPEDLIPCPELGMTLAAWVEQNVVDSLTEGQHALLRETALALASSGRSHQSSGGNSVEAQVHKSLHVFPAATVALATLLQIKSHKIDMSSLIKKPGELFISEDVWAGKMFRDRDKNRRGHGNESHPAKSEPADDEYKMQVDQTYRPEGPEELKEVLEYVANVIIELNQKLKREGENPTAADRNRAQATPSSGQQHQAGQVSLSALEGSGDRKEGQGAPPDDAEDPVLRELRLNLLALAKRAPLDTIARLPEDLVPEHIRHFIPTLSAPG